MKKVLDRRFDELDLFSEAVRNWDLDFRLLTQGGFLGHVIQFLSQDVLITYARLERGLDQSGSTPDGFRTFVIPGDACDGFWWRGHCVSNNDLLIFPINNELRSASGSDFEVYTISIRLVFLERISESLGLPAGPLDTEVVHLDARSMVGLRALAGMTVRSAGTPDLVQQLTEELIIRSSNKQSDARISVRKRDLAVNRILEYVRSNPAPDNGLSALCTVANVSERTLQYAFKERYGISPNVFVKRWKLNSARRLLINSNPSMTTVGDVASSLGFQYPSQFANDYKLLFAERPSQTLAKNH